jgi:hypothetical protein
VFIRKAVNDALYYVLKVFAKYWIMPVVGPGGVLGDIGERLLHKLKERFRRVPVKVNYGFLAFAAFVPVVDLHQLPPLFGGKAVVPRRPLFRGEPLKP